MDPVTRPKWAKIGGKLPNGATVVATAASHVLAHWEQEYITWLVIDHDGHAAHGHYFPYHQPGQTQLDALAEAVGDLAVRARGQ